MKVLSALLAFAVLLLCDVSIAVTSDVTMERPFGGPLPPPKTRKMGRWSRTCQTPTIACQLPKRRSVGAPCTCRANGGKPISGQVTDR
jgi:hypothetical protein